MSASAAGSGRAGRLRATSAAAAAAARAVPVLSALGALGPLRRDRGRHRRDGDGPPLAQLDAVRAATRVRLKAHHAGAPCLLEELREGREAVLALVEGGVLAAHRVLDDARERPLDALALERGERLLQELDRVQVGAAALGRRAVAPPAASAARRS